MKSPLVNKIVLFFLLCSLSHLVSVAKEIPAKSSTLVNDYAGVLNAQDKQILETNLRRYVDSTSTQIAVVIDQSLENEDAFDYSYRLARAWGIGSKENNNGVLLYFAIAEHKIRIQVGYGLEARLTDALCKRIIEQEIKPDFKQQQYAIGIQKGVQAIILGAAGEYKGTPQKAQKGSWVLPVIILLGIILVLYAKYKNVKQSHVGSDLGFWTILMLMNSGGGGHNRGNSWSDFSGGGGNFGGFGGGDFGGGGAGGDW